MLLHLLVILLERVLFRHQGCYLSLGEEHLNVLHICTSGKVAAKYYCYNFLTHLEIFPGICQALLKLLLLHLEIDESDDIYSLSDKKGN